jgi:hypothetical protein
MSRSPESGIKICVICHKPYTEYGNNAEPIRSGRCCNQCNDTVVIPRRIKRMRRKADQEKPLPKENHDQ